MPLKLITPPVLEPITVAEVKTHLRIESEAFADNISSTQSIAPGSHAIAAAWSLVGTGVDVLGSRTVVYFESGTNGAGGTVDVKIQESDTNVPANFTDWAAGAFAQVTVANDNATYEKEYTGAKQYIRVVSTVAGNACEFGVSVVEYAPYSAEDTLISDFIKAVRTWCQDYQGFSYITQTWDLSLLDWPRGQNYIELPYSPLQSAPLAPVVTYYDTDDVATVWAATNYLVDTDFNPGRIVLNYGGTWPTETLRLSKGVVIRYVAGYGLTGASVPDEIKLALKMLVGHFYENREATFNQALKEVPLARELLDINKVNWFGRW
jgi:uncharacterized phiE125 gp8 family phage protein